MSAAYRCCAHCADDPVHEVEPDSHEVPCNAPNSQGCVGRTAAHLSDTERAGDAE